MLKEYFFDSCPRGKLGEACYLGQTIKWKKIAWTVGLQFTLTVATLPGSFFSICRGGKAGE